MREPRVYLAAVIATLAFALYLAVQPPPQGPTGLRSFLPTATPTPSAEPTAIPGLGSIDAHFIEWIEVYGGDLDGWRAMLDGDCQTLADRLPELRAHIFEDGESDAEEYLALGYVQAIPWRQAQLGCSTRR